MPTNPDDLTLPVLLRAVELAIENCHLPVLELLLSNTVIQRVTMGALDQHLELLLHLLKGPPKALSNQKLVNVFGSSTEVYKEMLVKMLSFGVSFLPTSIVQFRCQNEFEQEVQPVSSQLT